MNIFIHIIYISIYLYIFIFRCTKVWDIMDSQNFFLPQRRNRVYGLAFMLTGHHNVDSVGESYKKTLKDMRSNYQFPPELLFGEKKMEKPTPRHAKLIAMAEQQNPYSRNLFIDCSSSFDRLTFGDGVLPCLTPSHGIYSTGLQRYLDKQDMLNSQGLWSSCFSQSAYQDLLTMDSQDVAGNSFSSTVCQAVMLCSLTHVPETWHTITKSHKEVHVQPLGRESAPDGYRRRLKRKQPVPNYEQLAISKPKVKSRKGQYRRKVAGEDGRKNSSGKKPSVSIWAKEQV